MFTPRGLDDVTKQRMLQARMLSREARGGRLNLGKKVSVPRDVMIEELTLPSNRGSLMFQERQRRAERFTLENVANNAHNTMSTHPVAVPPPQIIQQPQGGKENQAFSMPGYSGPLKEIPHEKFNKTVIPYWSPWREALRHNEELLEALNTKLPLPQRHQVAHYRCFNRSPMPFGGAPSSKRVIPIISFEAQESQNLPGIALDRMCHRPNFNRAPRGWEGHHCPESNEL
ncbi:myozenin-2 isoform X2 [Corythoichthys intestinalis]|uniref:myozenin-2 isoform X2 n=1 Tax=Corythoichthys intestinalis TaxID=161448 RepID=UPI0025A66C30|nr:myozenin-2 isoform X2 [Corythoichthys intestinalis]